jgi:CheY-like chemotaxis protein
MPEPKARSLQGQRLLVVEDDYFIAVELARSLEALGAEVVGPMASVADALEALAGQSNGLDGAILDIHLGEERVYPVADELMARGLPFVFLTGYDAVVIPDQYAHVRRCDKPVDTRLLVQILDNARTESGSAQQHTAG